MVQIKIVQTVDGSDTLYSEKHKAHYHSLNGALQESLHIYIKNGYELLLQNAISMLEVGFGTGLNAALTGSKAIAKKCKTSYTGIDLNPLSEEALSMLNYESVLSKVEYETWRKIISIQWGKEEKVNDYFILTKVYGDLIEINLLNKFDLIYFDAFAPDNQPEMWSIAVFEKLYKATNDKGTLVTYCSKGIVKQALRKVGYKVERLAGPIGKRHIIRATRC